MSRTIGGIAAVIALAAVAFCAAYFGGGALNKPPVAQATSGGAALHAPELAITSQPVALRTPTATPSPTATPKPKKKHTHKKKKSAAKKKVDDVQAADGPRPSRPGSPTPAPTAVYHPPASTPQPKKKKSSGSGGVIIED